MEEPWSVLTDEKLEAKMDSILEKLLLFEAKIDDISAKQTITHEKVLSIEEKLHQDSVRRRNKNIRRRVPFSFMPEASGSFR